MIARSRESTWGYLGVAVLSLTMVAFGSWLLVADVGNGAKGAKKDEREARSETKGASKTKGKASRKRLLKAAVTVGSQYGGGDGCSTGFVNVATARPVPATGGMAVMASDSDLLPPGNADRNTEAFLVGEGAKRKQVLAQMTTDAHRCVGGTKHGQACTPDSGGYGGGSDSRDCAGGFCAGTEVGDSAVVANGSNVVAYFVYDGNPAGGNPAGENPDLGDELWRFDFNTKKGTGSAVRLTTQAGWCSNEIARDCSSRNDCEGDGSCILSNIDTIQVGEGKSAPVLFTTTGNPDGGNPSHGAAVYGVVVKRTKKGTTVSLQLASTTGRVCGPNTANAGQACTKDDDCGATCGNGGIEAGEQCDSSGVAPRGCGNAQFCFPPGVANQCTCGTPTCGDTFIDAGEECDSGPSSTECLACKSDCTCVQCGDGVLEAPEQCDTASPCSGNQACSFAVETQCQCITPVCGNKKIEGSEECDSLTPASGPCILCKPDCTCVICGDGTIEAPETCDPGSFPIGCGVGQTCTSNCTCL